jgi:uncharacterized protein (DUF2249 family)
MKTAATHTLDIRGLAPQAAKHHLFALFDRLTSGETVAVLSDSSPRCNRSARGSSSGRPWTPIRARIRCW